MGVNRNYSFLQNHKENEFHFALKRNHNWCLLYDRMIISFGSGMGWVGIDCFLRNQHLKPHTWGVSSQPSLGLCSFCFFELNNPFKIYLGTTLLEPSA